MTADEFRRFGYQAVDWVADYLETNRTLPVVPKIHPGELTSQLPPHGPEQGEAMEAILEDFRSVIVPAITHWNHPRFLAYYAASASAPGILAELLSAAVNVNAMVWKTGPASTELEQVTLGWLREWLGLPAEFFGILHDTASTSTFHALAAARDMADPEARERGNTQPLVVYTSEHAHSSVERAVLTLGLGHENARLIPSDREFRMRPDALAAAIAADRAAGRKPCCVVATVGTTATSSIDPVPAIADIAEAHGLWLHVDGAYGGPAALLPEFRWIFDGVSRADSLVINPHKWLFTPIDASILYTRRPDILRRAFTLVPEFLRTAEDGHAVNYMDYGVPLGRRFRSLKLWFVFRYYGREGLANFIRNHIAWAKRLAGMIAADPNFEVVAPTPLSLICFRLRGSDECNRMLLEAVNASGQAFLSHTVLNGQYVLRLAIGNVRTTWSDLEETWDLIRHSAGRSKDANA